MVAVVGALGVTAKSAFTVRAGAARDARPPRGRPRASLPPSAPLLSAPSRWTPPRTPSLPALRTLMLRAIRGEDVERPPIR